MTPGYKNILTTSSGKRRGRTPPVVSLQDNFEGAFHLDPRPHPRRRKLPDLAAVKHHDGEFVTPLQDPFAGAGGLLEERGAEDFCKRGHTKIIRRAISTTA